MIELACFMLSFVSFIERYVSFGYIETLEFATLMFHVSLFLLMLAIVIVLECQNHLSSKNILVSSESIQIGLFQL